MKNFKQLPDGEYKIMDIVWNNPTPISSKDIYNCQNSGESLSMSALHTLLQRLSKKEFLDSCKEGKERYYSPLIEKEEYLRYDSKKYINKRLKGSSFQIVRALIEEGTLNSFEIEQLKNLLNDTKE